jgi:tRNA A37 threonylcarbamoyladenosine synthetase subunit TsaC/SUA5/YrdC
MDRRGTGKRKTVGIRIVDHPLHRMLMERLEEPLVSTSITSGGEFYTDPEDLDRMYGSRVSAVIDGGIRHHDLSTILDCTEGYLQLIRKGIGDLSGIEVGEAP